MSSAKAYYQLIKPGIVYGNLLHVSAGILLAGPAAWSWLAAVSAWVGTGLVIAGACVANNLIDRPYDARMTRTKKRPLVVRTVSAPSAAVFSAVLALAGFAFLYLGTNSLTVVLGIIAFISYVLIYTYSKRFTVHSTIIGTLPGALPAMAGYTSMTGGLDSAAWLLLVFVGVWQLPHFYAISVFRRDEYKAAGWPVLATVYRESVVRRIVLATLMLCWMVGLTLGVNLLHPVAAVLLIASVSYWLYVAVRPHKSYHAWGRSVFVGSMFVSLGLLVATLVNFAIRLFIQ